MQEQNREFEQEINLREYIDVIMKRKKLILSIFFVSVILSAIVSLMAPKVYQGTALIMIVPSRMQSALSSTAISLDYKMGSAALASPAQSASISLSTHKQLLKTNVVLNTMIDKLQLTDKTDKKINAEDLSKRLSVKDTKETNILQLDAKADDPKQAQKLANTWAREYVVYNQELISGEVRGTGDFVVDQFEIAKKNLTQSEESIKDFKDKYKIDLMRAEIDIKKATLNSSKKELPDLEMMLKTKEDALKELKKEVAKQERFIVVSKAITDEALWQKSSKEENIGDLNKKKLRSEEINPIYRDLETRIVDTEIELNTLKPRVEYLEKSITSTEKEINSLEKTATQKEFELVQLNRQMEIYKRTYDNLSTKIEEARIAKAAQLGEVKIVSPSIEPKNPAGAGRRKNVILAGILSLMLGTFLAFFMEFLEKSKK
jgi:succinoglycan biosynthesis transport protein ExoP